MASPVRPSEKAPQLLRDIKEASTAYAYLLRRLDAALRRRRLGKEQPPP